jgi:hypothetical protein
VPPRRATHPSGMASATSLVAEGELQSSVVVLRQHHFPFFESKRIGVACGHVYHFLALHLISRLRQLGDGPKTRTVKKGGIARMMAQRKSAAEGREVLDCPLEAFLSPHPEQPLSKRFALAAEEFVDSRGCPTRCQLTEQSSCHRCCSSKAIALCPASPL